MLSIMNAMDAQRFDLSKRTRHCDLPQPADGLTKSFEAYHNHEEDENSSHDGDTLHRNQSFLFDIAQAVKRSCLHVIPTLPVGANASHSDVSTVQNEYKDHDEAKNKLREKETDTLLDVHAALSEKRNPDSSVAAATIPPVPFPGTRETKTGTEITDVFNREDYTAVRTILRPRPSFFNMSKFRSGGSEHGHVHGPIQTGGSSTDSIRPRLLSAPTNPSSRIGFHFGSLNCLSTDAFEEQVDVIQEERARALRGENIEILCEKTFRVVEERVPVACAVA
ncbi:hypothetical protein D9619_001597 [Psilocybe cf. subviscida]|uniref:Uncharacterized protein n=1 Tax=Psilocybe cf. subviscida TaxID=2480587 RepID=A0A8H5F2B0_9AGAR|nr:hypothetical protein D9619_001597 [Psilocybe cf. subviscida]